MSDLISSGGDVTEVREAPTDVTGGWKFAEALVVGLLGLVGVSYFDLLGLRKDKKNESETKSDEETQADYEKEYLDEEISEDALDEHTVGLTA